MSSTRDHEPGNRPLFSRALNIGALNITPPVMLAPMAGITSWPLRLLCRQAGAPLAFTEMVAAAAIARGKPGLDTLNALKTHPEDRPLGIQIFGHDPAEMAQAARQLSALEADLIDVNMGCPVKKVVKRGGGAGLMRDLERAKSMIGRVREAVKIPLTVKMRLGWDHESQNAAELAQICEELGVDAVTVHARTRAQGFGGDPDLPGLKRVVEALTIPVIGNGGIMNARDAARMMEFTGCAGVMVARGARGNPWIFSQLTGRRGPEETPALEQKAEVILRHLDYLLEMMPAKSAALQMRKHLSWYSKGIKGAVDLRRELQHLAAPEQVKDLVQRYFLEPAAQHGD